ncbi:hypothetical protein MMC20_000187 [Loxospora ochrophaea]|nr:hypothetical protein [Loxospora ochrophaea]
MSTPRYAYIVISKEPLDALAREAVEFARQHLEEEMYLDRDDQTMETAADGTTIIRGEVGDDEKVVEIIPREWFE